MPFLALYFFSVILGATVDEEPWMAPDSLFDMRGEAKGFLRAANNTINWGLVILSCPVITKSGIITGQQLLPMDPSSRLRCGYSSRILRSKTAHRYSTTARPPWHSLSSILSLQPSISHPHGDFCSSPSFRPLPWAPPSFPFVVFIHDCILAAWLLVALLLSTCTGCSLLPFVITPSLVLE